MLKLVAMLTCAPDSMPDSLLRSFTPINPALVSVATGKATLLPVLLCSVRVSPVPVRLRLVPTLTWAPASMPLSLTRSAWVMAPASVVLAAGISTLLPLELVIVTAVPVRVRPRLVATLTSAPASMPPSLSNCAVVISPAVVLDATGKTTLLPVDDVTLRLLPEPPMPRLVPTLTWAPSWMPASLIFSVLV